MSTSHLRQSAFLLLSTAVILLMSMLPIYKVKLVLKEKSSDGRLIPLANTTVSIVVNGSTDTARVRTNENGYTEELVLPRGKHRLDVTAEGFNPVTKHPVRINASSGTHTLVLIRK